MYAAGLRSVPRRDLAVEAVEAQPPPHIVLIAGRLSSTSSSNRRACTTITLMIPAIVLAAGRSTRMGRPKPTLPIGDDTFLTRIVRTFVDADVDDVVVVVGHEKDVVVRDFVRSGLRARFVDNVDYASGQLSSILAGLQVVDRPGVDATLITLVDVPFVSAATVRAVVECFARTRAPLVRPTRGRAHGHPVLVARSLFDALRHADAKEGAKPIVRANASAAGDMPSDDDGAFIDIDTPEEYMQALRSFGGGHGRPLSEEL